MTAERKSIRCFFKDRLLGKTAAGANVTAQRVDPIRPQTELGTDDVFASLMVYTLREAVTTYQDTPRTYTRTLDLAVEIFAEGGPAVDDEAVEDLIDDVCDQVECVVDPLIPQLLAVRVPGGELLDVNPSKSGLVRVEIGFDAEGRQLAGAARLLWAIEYGTAVDERAQARATDLETVRVTYRFPPPDGIGDVVAEDEIEDSGG